MGRRSLAEIVVREVRRAPPPGEWADHAACRRVAPGLPEPERMNLFFQSRGQHVPEWFKDLCASCPVLPYCRTYALRWPVQGLWAGMGEKERLALRRRTREAS
ncbi:MAG: WhiB family transcriptional regulator [Candidatus Dormibacteria bacterium]